MQIEKNIPLPDARKSRGPGNGYGWKNMEVGDSMFFPDEPKGANSPPAISARGCAFRTNMKFTARAQNGGVRIWRVE